MPSPLSPCVTELAAEQPYHPCHTGHDGVPTVSFRYFTVYGRRESPDTGFTCFFEALQGTAIQRSGDGRKTPDFTCAADAVAATT